MNRTVRADVVIDAPSELVWSILEDFERYAEWNAFTPKVILRGRNLGDGVELHVRMGRSFNRVMQENLRLYEPPHRIGWGVSMGGGHIVEATRFQEVVDLDGGRCRYSTYETFDGALGGLVVVLFGKSVEAGFRKCAEGLKAHAEARHRSNN